MFRISSSRRVRQIQTVGVQKVMLSRKPFLGKLQFTGFMVHGLRLSMWDSVVFSDYFAWCVEET